MATEAQNLTALLGNATDDMVPWGQVAAAFDKVSTTDEPMQTAAALAFLIDDLDRFASTNAGVQVFYQKSRSKGLVLALPGIFQTLGEDDIAGMLQAVRDTVFAQ